MQRTLFASGLLTALLGLTSCGDSPPSGQQQGGREALQAICKADIDKHCPGEERIGQCLRRHESELSSECTAALKERTGKRQ